jgi:hypothetical protein
MIDHSVSTWPDHDRSVHNVVILSWYALHKTGWSSVEDSRGMSKGVWVSWAWSLPPAGKQKALAVFPVKAS